MIALFPGTGRLGFYKPSERIAELCGLRGASSW
jgi:hypothetical protein